MKKRKLVIFGVIFALLCLAVFLFFRPFTRVVNTTRGTVTFRSAEFTPDQGKPVSVNPYNSDNNPVRTDGVYTFHGTVSGWGTADTLLLSLGSCEMTLQINGKAVFSGGGDRSDTAAGMSQITVPLPADIDSAELTLECRYFEEGGVWVYPPVLSLQSPLNAQADTMGYANMYAIPAGVFALTFLLLCGLYLFSFLQDKAEHSLTLLIAAAAIEFVFHLVVANGYFALPAGLNDFLQPFLLNLQRFLVPLLINVYVVWNRKRPFFKYFGVVNLVTAGALLVVYVISAVADRFLSNMVDTIFLKFFQTGSYFNVILHWLIYYLIFTCAVASLVSMISRFVRLRTKAQAMELQSSLMLKQYESINRGIRGTYAIRHEWKNNIMAMRLLCSGKKYRELEEYLRSLSDRSEKMTPLFFSKNIVFNVLLQNAAARAEEAGIRFSATANVPEEVGIETGDLCSLLMNMLDNAIEASLRLPEAQRSVTLSAGLINKGFLTVTCVNRCDRSTAIRPDGTIDTDKENRLTHGFGLTQMREVAEKYHSLLNITCCDGVFTVSTALQQNSGMNSDLN